MTFFLQSHTHPFEYRCPEKDRLWTCEEILSKIYTIVLTVVEIKRYYEISEGKVRSDIKKV